MKSVSRPALAGLSCVEERTDVQNTGGNHLLRTSILNRRVPIMKYTVYGFGLGLNLGTFEVNILPKQMLSNSFVHCKR